MVNYKILILIFISFFTYCSIDSAYKTEVEWNIFVENNNPFEISILITSDTSLEEWYRPQRLDTLATKQFILKGNSNSVLNVKYLYRPQDYDVEPCVEKPNQFKCNILIDSLNSRILNAEIDLFPFPEWEDYKLCDEYFVDDPKRRSYICYCFYQDTVELFQDTAFSTAEYFKIIH